MDYTAVQNMFCLERTYPTARDKVFAAWASTGPKRQWFGGPPTPGGEYTLDFSVGGRERLRAEGPGGQIFELNAEYQNIVQGTRIVYTYVMDMGDQRISASLVTVEFRDDAGGTRLIYTEQGVFLDGLDKPQQREKGTEQMLGALGEVAAKI